MRYSVQLHPQSSFSGLTEIVRFAKRAEELGYYGIHIPEHVIFGLEQEQLMGPTWWDPLVLGTHLADHTTSLRLIFSVLVLPQHNPVRLAKSVATLDQVSGGRVELGAGVGWLEEEFAALGVPFERRGARAEEHIRVLRTLWSPVRPSSFHGEFFSFDDMSFDPRPLQSPHPPIWIGGSVQKSVRRAAALGDGWFPMGVDLDTLEPGIARLHEAMERADRDPAAMMIMAKLPFWEASAKATAHALEAGASDLAFFDGDLGRADAHIDRAERMGVTNMWVELPVDPQRRLHELERFATHVIAVE